MGAAPMERVLTSSQISNHSPVLRNDHVIRDVPRDYQYAYPHGHREQLPTASPANVERAPYPYNQTPTATMPTYNTHNHSQEYCYGPYTESHGNVIQNTSNGDQFSSDLTCWQQKHQEALRRQQLEMSQVREYYKQLEMSQVRGIF
jgi:hypothetical protein